MRPRLCPRLWSHRSDEKLSGFKIVAQVSGVWRFVFLLDAECSTGDIYLIYKRLCIRRKHATSNKEPKQRAGKSKRTDADARHVRAPALAARRRCSYWTSHHCCPHIFGCVRSACLLACLLSPKRSGSIAPALCSSLADSRPSLAFQNDEVRVHKIPI